MFEFFLFIFIPLLAWVIIIYNLLVRDKIRVETAWSDIQVQLKRRHDLIPKLIDAVKQYAAFENATMTTITELRTRSEQSQDVKDLQHNLTDVENHIQYARRYYNGAVRNLNIRVESFPDLFLARFFNFRKANYFQTELE